LENLEDLEDFVITDGFPDEEFVTREPSVSEEMKQKDQATRILNILEKSTTTEKLDFSNGLINFVDKLERRNIDALLPALKLLAKDQPEIRQSVLNQFKSLVSLVSDKFGDEGYIKVVEAVFPLLDDLLYDPIEEIRDKAISVVAEMRKVVKEAEKEHIMKLTLSLAHEESNEKYRESAVKLLNELAPDMG
jgi:hypothetical protein